MKDEPGTSISRRRLLSMIGMAAGSTAMYQAMHSLGFAAESTFRGARQLCATFACCVVLTSAVLIEAPALAHTAGILNSTPLNTTDGQQIYEHVCQGCHMRDAAGAVGAGHYPVLAKNPALASRRFMALAILLGRRNMPAFGARHAIGFGGPPAVLSEAQIAAVINYVRSHFGNHFKDQITEAEVGALDQGANF